jgi:heme oxygenase
MGLRELTQDRHHAAENTDFMQAVIAGIMPLNIWAQYTQDRIIWYSAIEYQAQQQGLLSQLPGIQRTQSLVLDLIDMTGGIMTDQDHTQPLAYHDYIMNLTTADQVMAHLYTWHMGDLYGGQMIKRMISAPCRSLDFDNADQLKQTIRIMLHDGMADEVNGAFDWAIKILNEYKV